ncbi:hypothetical protein [Haloarchaeobius amylolyticus]|uniref:hypothetical protein n=1 Tax=Haloarchaeobius amylolyticus TaxID=1198296 RepID=UPI00226DD8B7|nr:hypothetical protein [Haloarchaeobius amylolyticus]
MTNYDFNPTSVQQLIDEYRAASNDREKWVIENKILAITLWDTYEKRECGFAAFTEDELEKIKQAVDTDDKEVKRLLRRAYVKRL